MTSPGVSLRSFVWFSVLLHGWIALLAYALKVLFGAELTGGWLVAGILFSLIAIGVLLIVKELFAAVEWLLHQEWRGFRAPAKVARHKKTKPIRKAGAPVGVDSHTTAHAYRTALGLKPWITAANRRRSRLFSAGHHVPHWQNA